MKGLVRCGNWIVQPFEMWVANYHPADRDIDPEDQSYLEIKSKMGTITLKNEAAYHIWAYLCKLADTERNL